MNKRIAQVFTRNIKPILLITALLTGILLVAMSEKTDIAENENGQNYDEYSKLDVYTADTEKRLESIISRVSGAGQAKVMISFESSFESVYANNAKLEENTAKDVMQSAKTTEKQMVLASDKANGETPILLKELCPRVKGVLVVCSGGDNAKVREEVKTDGLLTNEVAQIKEIVVNESGFSADKVKIVEKNS